MSELTITILQGADRGKIYDTLTVPMTIGREEGNTIQLNDERVSRCHIKIQRDNDRLVLTDLDSTNGTKVNGQETSLRILRYGDLITVGRTLLLFGSEAQISQRMERINNKADESTSSLNREVPSFEGIIGFGSEGSPANLSALMGLIEPPEVPDALTPGQAAQFCEILEYLQMRLLKLIETAEVDENANQVKLKFSSWQRLLDLQARLARMVRSVANP